MGNNVIKYKPGQFVKVDAPGKYRMAFTKGTVENVLSQANAIFLDLFCLETTKIAQKHQVGVDIL